MFREILHHLITEKIIHSIHQTSFSKCKHNIYPNPNFTEEANIFITKEQTKTQTPLTIQTLMIQVMNDTGMGKDTMENGDTSTINITIPAVTVTATDNIEQLIVKRS